jgi:hypothetical protein
MLGFNSGIDGIINVTPFKIMTVCAVIGALITVAIQTYKVLLELNAKKKALIGPLCNLLPFLVFFPASFIYCLYSSIALQEYPIITMLLISSIFTEIVTHIMLMHICDAELTPSGRITAWLLVLLPLHVCYNQYYNIEKDFFLGIDEVKLLKVLALASVVFTGSKLYMVSIYILLFIPPIEVILCHIFISIYFHISYLFICVYIYSIRIYTYKLI